MKLFKLRQKGASRRRAQGRFTMFRKNILPVGLLALLGVSLAYGWSQGYAEKVALWTKTTALQKTADAGFRVREILVTGRKHVGQEELLAALGISRDVPIFSVSVGVVQQGLADMPFVRQVSVSRRLPDTILIALDERVPAAFWQRAGKVSVIDAEGVVLSSSDLSRFDGLPLLVGPKAEQHVGEIAGLLRAEPEIASHVAAAVRVGGRRWDLRLDNGLTVRLPEKETGYAMRRLAQMASGGLFTKNITEVDLRIPDKAVIALGKDADNKPAVKNSI